jgi:hypothetical protein
MTDAKVSSETSSTKLIFCNHCKNETHHICQAKYLRERHYGVEWEETWYRLWICAGCEDATLEISYQNSSYGDECDTSYHPKRTEYDVADKRFIELPDKLYRIYRETIQSFNSGLNVLCAAGLRALLEGICVDKGIEGQTLEVRIGGLLKILPSNIVTNLHSFRFIGNEAIHELTPPTNDALRLAIEIIEDLLNFLCELDYKTSRLTRYRQTGSTLTPPPRIIE